MSNLTVFHNPNAVSFENLNEVITKLGDSSKELSADEKASACMAIESWEKLVIEKIRTKANEMQAFLNVMSHGPFNCTSAQEEAVAKLKAICYQIGLQEKYDSLAAAIKAAQDYQSEERPTAPRMSEGVSNLENRRLHAAYQSEVAKYNIQLEKLNRKAYLIWDDISKSLKKNVDCKEMLKSCNDWLGKQNKFYNGAREKAEIAKMNVSISSSEVRQLLRQMFDYEVEI